MRLNEAYMGSTTLEPSRDIVAGEFSTWVFTFTAGEYGIDDGGTLVLCWKSVSDWGVPQFDDPAAPNYTTVTTTGDCRVRGQYAKFVRSFGNSIRVDVNGGYLKKGDRIVITLGDRSGGSIGMRAQSFCEREHEFKVYLDPCGTFRYEPMPKSHKIRIRAGWAHEIQAIIPGSVPVGQPFDELLRALDEFGNPTEKYTGTVHVSAPELAVEGLPEQVTFRKENDGVARISGCTVKAPGIWHLRLEDRENRLFAYSNASCATESEPYSLFWGDAHGQTKLTVGTGSMEDYYAFARDKAGVDFTGWQGNDFEVTEEAWQEVRRQTKAFHQDGKFVVFLGYEWSGTTPQGGDHNVYFLDDSEEFYPSSNWTATSVKNDRNCNPVTELFDVARRRGDMLLIPHIGGRFANLDYYDPQLIHVIEIHSHHGTFEWFAMDAMRRHLKVGFIATSDDHTCRPGLSYPLSKSGRSASSAFDVASGFSGVYAKGLTRKDLWEAIQARRCYASTFDRVFLDMKVDGHWMGEEYRCRAGAAPQMHLRAAGIAPIENIKVYDWDKELASIDLLPKSSGRIRVRWSGVLYKGRGKSAPWDGMLYVENGRLRGAKTYAFDRLDQGICVCTDKYVSWESSTSGDYDGLILDIEGGGDTVLRFSSKQGCAEVPLKEIQKGCVMKDMGGLNLRLEFCLAPETADQNAWLPECQTEKMISLPEEPGEHAFWAKVTQSNGNAAWVSPVFVTILE